MKINDPARPMINHVPALVGIPFPSIVPEIRVYFESFSLVSLRVFVPIEHNVFSALMIIIPIEEIPNVLLRYFQDPEETLQKSFGWKYYLRETPRPALVPPVNLDPSAFSLEDF